MFILQNVKIFETFMNKGGIKCLKFYYQEAPMPGLEGMFFSQFFKIEVKCYFIICLYDMINHGCIKL